MPRKPKISEAELNQKFNEFLNKLSDIPPLEELVPKLKDEKILQVISQHKLSQDNLDRIKRNFHRNYPPIKASIAKRYVIPILSSGKEVGPKKFKEIDKAVQEYAKEKAEKEIGILIVRSKNQKKLNDFKRQIEKEIGDKLIGTGEVGNRLCLLNHSVIKKYTNSDEIRCFKFNYGEDKKTIVYLYSETDVKNLARRERNIIVRRQNMAVTREVNREKKEQERWAKLKEQYIRDGWVENED